MCTIKSAGQSVARLNMCFGRYARLRFPASVLVVGMCLAGCVRLLGGSEWADDVALFDGPGGGFHVVNRQAAAQTFWMSGAIGRADVTRTLETGTNLVSYPYPVDVAFSNTAWYALGAPGRRLSLHIPDETGLYFTLERYSIRWFPGTNVIPAGRAALLINPGGPVQYTESKPYPYPDESGGARLGSDLFTLDITPETGFVRAVLLGPATGDRVSVQSSGTGFDFNSVWTILLELLPPPTAQVAVFSMSNSISASGFFRVVDGEGFSAVYGQNVFGYRRYEADAGARVYVGGEFLRDAAASPPRIGDLFKHQLTGAYSETNSDWIEIFDPGMQAYASYWKHLSGHWYRLGDGPADPDGIPSAPRDVSASYKTYTNRVRLVWADTPGAFAYRLWRALDPSAVQTQLLASVADTSYDDWATVTGQSYFYWVQSVSSGGTSEFSRSAMGLAEVPVVLFVSTNGTATAPYATLETAETNLLRAVSNAPRGALVRVDRGRFVGRLTLGDSVSLRSLWGPDATTLVGGATLSAGSVLDGFTVTEGVSVAGGGIYCSPGARVANCVIVSNTAVTGGGGGVYVDGAGLIERCVIRGNTAFSPSGGGGVYLSGGGLVRNCLVEGNTAPDGAGVFLDGGGEVQSTTVIANQGAGLHCAGGGSAVNSILFQNGVNVSSNGVALRARHCFSVPLLAGDNNITGNPHFEPGSGALTAHSPCLNAGLYYPWMTDDLDLNGNLRIYAAVPDIGADEFTVSTHVSAVLGGAWNSAGMRTQLTQVTDLMAVAPYAGSASALQTLPSNAVDWVLVQVQDTNNFDVVDSVAGMLLADGTISGNGTSAEVRLEPPIGLFYITIKHRNHLARTSQQPVAYTNRIAAYDFSVAASGPTSTTAVEVATGVWALIPGDVDGDGRITHVDHVIISNSLSNTGYLQADINLDGVVTEQDQP